MSEENDIFNDDTEANSGPVIDPNKNYFEEYVGEGKKYKDEVAAGRALIEKDLFIEQLKREAEEARQELRSRMSVEEAMTKLTQERQEGTSGEATSHRETESGDVKETSTSENVDIRKLVEEEITSRERARMQAEAKAKEEQNLATVRDRLTKVYGPNFAAEVKMKAEELGVSTQFLTEAGAKEPNVLFRLLGVDSQPRDITNPAPAQSRINTAATTRPNSGVRNNAYYQEMRKKDPSRFWSSAVQSQRHKDALQQGDSFFQ